MQLERLLWKQIVCHFKFSDFRRFFSVLCVRGPNDEKSVTECTQLVVEHVHDDELVTGAGENE